jgi:hypothetical protein
MRVMVAVCTKCDWSHQSSDVLDFHEINTFGAVAANHLAFTGHIVSIHKTRVPAPVGV